MQYFVKKGKHNRWTMPRLHLGVTYLRFAFKFDDSCLYPIVDTDDFDLNKLFGWSFGMHHKNSLRICWRPDEKNADMIQVHAYMYEQGVRYMEFICRVGVGKWYVAKIEASEKYNTAEFAISDVTGKELIGKRLLGFQVPKFKWGYFLDFFMGGNKPARQDTVAWVEIQEIKRF